MRPVKKIDSYLDVLRAFLPDTARSYTVKEVQTRLGLSYEPTYRHLLDLVKRGHLTVKNANNTSFYSLDLENPETRQTIKFLKQISDQKPAVIGTTGLLAKSGMISLFLFVLFAIGAVSIAPFASGDLITGFALRGPVSDGDLADLPTIVPDETSEEDPGNEPPPEEFPTIISPPAEQFDVDASIKDADGNQLQASVIFKNKDTGLTAASSGTSARTGTLKLPTGIYDVDIGFSEGPVTAISITELVIDSGIQEFIRVDDTPENEEIVNLVELYAIDPTSIDFNSATVTAVAEGEELWKCRDWDFASRTCNGDWVKLLDLTPGQEYTFTLTPEDPAFAQNASATAGDSLVVVGSTVEGSVANTTTLNNDSWKVQEGNVREYYYSESEALSTTTSATFQNKTILAFTPATAGTYLIIAQANMSGQSATTDVQARLTIDGTVEGDINWQPDTVDDQELFVTHKVVNLTAASHTLILQFAAESGQTTEIANARIFALRLDNEFFYNASEAFTTPATTMTNKTVLAFTPASAGNFLRLSTAEVSSGSTSVSIFTEAVLDGTTVSDADIEGEATTDFEPFAAHGTTGSISGSHTTWIRAQAESGSTQSIGRARITMLRLTDVFNFASNSSTAASATTSTTFQNKTMFTFTANETGEWLILGTADVTLDAATNGQYIDTQIVLDGTVQSDMHWGLSDTTDIKNFFGARVVNVTAGSHLLQLQWRTFSTATATISNAYLTAVKLPLYRAEVWTNSTTVSQSGTITNINATIVFNTTSADEYEMLIYNWTADAWTTNGCSPRLNVTANTSVQLWCNQTSGISHFLSSDNKTRIALNETTPSLKQDNMSIDFIQYFGFADAPPNVALVSPAAGTDFMINDTVTITANVTDDAGVSIVSANITKPDGSIDVLALPNVGGTNYSADFTNLTLRGRYNVTFIANDTLNQINSSTTTFFNRISPSSVDLFNSSMSPINYSTLVVSNVSGILNLSITVSNSRIQVINITNHDESSPYNTMSVEDPAPMSDTPLGTFAEYAIDASGMNSTNISVTVNATGDNKLVKCLDYNMTAMECTDGIWTELFDITPGVLYTFFLAPGDPGFLETSEAIDVDMAPIDNNTFVIAFVDNVESDISFRIMNTNGSVVLDTVDADTTVDADSRVSVTMINATQFALAWVDGPEDDITTAIYDTSGTLLAGPTDVDTSAGLNTDVSVTQLGDRYVLCWADNAGNDATYTILNNTGATTIVAATDIDTDTAPGATLQNLVECSGISSTRWAFNWFDDTDNDATEAIISEAGATIAGPTDIDTDVGETGQVAVASINNDAFAMVFYDSTDDDITIAIRSITNTVILAPTDIDTDAGTVSRVAISAVRENMTATTDSFVVAWQDQASGDIKAAVYGSTGTELTAPFVVEASPDPTFTLVDVMSRDPITGLSICPGTFAVAYTNSSDVGVFKTFFANGTAWNGFCDFEPPAITIVAPSPANNSFVSSTTVSINATVIDALTNVEVCTLNFNGTDESMDKVSSGLSVTCNKTKTGLPEGTHNYTVSANDSAGNVGSNGTFFFTVDVTAPTIGFVAPTEDSGVSRSRDYIEVNVTAADANLANITIRLYNSTGDLINSSTTGSSPNFINFTGLADGLYFYNATANDSAGNTNSTETRNITLDTTGPVVTYVAPTLANNSFTNSNFVFVNITAVDALSSIDVCTLDFDGVDSSMTEVGAGTSITCNQNNTGLADGLHNFTASANDTLGNVGTEGTRFITVDTVAPTIEFVLPTEISGSLLPQDYIQVNVTAADTNLANITIRLYNSTGDQINSSTTATSPNFINFTGLADGLYFFNATAEDLAGNINATETRNVTLDTLAPLIEFVDPTKANNSFVTGNVTINVTAVDSSLDEINIFMNGSVVTTCSTSPCEFIFETALFADGSVHSFNATANDSFTNSNSTGTRFYTVDNTAPLITVVVPSPANNSLTSSTSVTINTTVSDATSGVDKCTLNFNGTDISTISPTGDVCEFAVSSLPDGLHNWTVFVNDTADPINDTGTYYFTVDTTAPTVTYESPTPANNSYVATNWILTNVTVTDATTSVDVCTLDFDGVDSSMTKVGAGLSVTCNKNNTGLAEGVHNFTVSANDSAGNPGSEGTRFVTVDTTIPTIEFVAPTEASGTFFSRDYIAVNVTATDTNLANITIRLFNSTGDLINSSTTGSSPNFINFTGLAEGLYFYNATANDPAGNVNSTETRNITLDTTAPIITGPTVTSITSSSAKVNWGTDDLANSTVNYGLNTSLGTLATNATLAALHNITLTSLAESTTYFFNVTSCNGAGNCTTVGPFNFTTAAPAPPAPPGGAGGGGLPPTNVTPPANVTLPELGEVIVVDGEVVSELRDQLDIPVFDTQTLNLVLFNPTNQSMQNIIIGAQAPDPMALPQPMHFPFRIGWDLEFLTGWSIVSDVLDPTLMRWQLEVPEQIDTLGPGERLELPLGFTAPLSLEDSSPIVLQVFTNGTLVFNRTIQVNVATPETVVASEYNPGTDTADIYLLVNDPDLAGANDIFIEFSVNEPGRSIIYEYFGPYSTDSEGRLLLAQSYHFADYIGGQGYGLNIKVYRGITIVGEAFGVLDLTQRPANQAPITGLFSLFG